jgi:hypothetical protein
MGQSRVAWCGAWCELPTTLARAGEGGSSTRDGSLEAADVALGRRQRGGDQEKS